MKQLKKYADRQFRTLTELLAVYELTMEQEVLHRIRVELKKIKAIFNLIKYCSDDFNINTEYRSLKKIFSKAGKIREIDVSENLFREYHIKNINKEKKSEEKNRLISEFRRNISGYKKTVAEKGKRVEEYFEKISSVCYAKYLNIKKEGLQKQIFPLLIESKLHKSRKIIKEIIYLSGISRWRKKILDASYDVIQEAIGKWHDKIMLLNLIREQKLDIKGNITKILNLKSQNELKEIEKLIKNFYDSGDANKMVIYKSVN